MGPGRRFIDLAFDFIVLVLGLGILIHGMNTVYKIQDEEMNRAIDVIVSEDFTGTFIRKYATEPVPVQ